MRLSNNFWLSEFTASATADKYGIDNSPDDIALVAIVALVHNVMQKLRNVHGRVIVSSGYRSAALNVQVGGSSNSQHHAGSAVDFTVEGKSCKEICQWLQQSDLPVDQCILEYEYDEHGKEVTQWIHLSHERFGKNRGEFLTAYVRPDGTEYVAGIV